MNLDEKQKELILLTIKIDIAVQQFNLLCDELEKLKKNNFSPNSIEYKKILKKFTKIYDEIVEFKIKLNNI